MPRLAYFEVKDLPAIRVTGNAIRPDMSMGENPIPAFWGQCFTDGTFAALEALGEFAFCGDYVGLMCDWSVGDGKFTYLCGMLMKTRSPVPEGFVSRDLPPCRAAVGWIQGPEKENYSVAHEMTQQEMIKQGFKADESAGWCMELYNCPRITVPHDNGDVILDYYIPCVKA